MRNVEMIELVARRLGELREEVVFLGGAVAALLVTDPGAAVVRFTADVDVIVDVGSKVAYDRLAQRLRDLGFREDMSEDAPICRWLVGEVKVDVMPTAAEVLGFGNRWYAPAIRNAETRTVGDQTVQVVSAPFFLATKLEAFDGRGRGDYRGSHDLEDIVAVVDGREEIVDEVLGCSEDLRAYLAARIGRMLGTQRFRDALPGHLPGDAASQARLPIILRRLEAIAAGRKP
jgi:predicted nucleotidyltransferase